MTKNNKDASFENIDSEIDKLISHKDMKEEKKKYTLSDRIRFAHEIKQNPPKTDFMKTEVKPAIYSIDLNTDAHWWFNHTCTVFPLLLTQAKRTYFDLQDSFKKERRLPDFNYMFILIIIMGLGGVFLIANMFFRFF